MADSRPLVMHVIYRLQAGGLENGLVNLINHLPADRYRHAIACLTEATDFRHRIRRDDVDVIELRKRPGHDLGLYRNLYRIFRQYRPAIVHTRNLAALEAQVPAALAGVPARIHGEHGWDVADLDGRRYRRWKRMLRPFVHHYIALSQEIERYLREEIGVPGSRITRILNGVDKDRFRPRSGSRSAVAGMPKEVARRRFLIGTVGRLEAVKNQHLLLQAFRALCGRHAAVAQEAALVIVGEGSERAALEAFAQDQDLADRIWFAGNRDDVPDLLQALDLFVLPSLAEGISNTIMEAMASGLPVVATAVGGNPELVVPGETGILVPSGDPEALADALAAYLEAPERMRRDGQAGRRRAERLFSLSAMVERYQSVYDRFNIGHRRADVPASDRKREAG